MKRRDTLSLTPSRVVRPSELDIQISACSRQRARVRRLQQTATGKTDRTFGREDQTRLQHVQKHLECRQTLSQSASVCSVVGKKKKKKPAEPSSRCTHSQAHERIKAKTASRGFNGGGISAQNQLE